MMRWPGLLVAVALLSHGCAAHAQPSKVRIASLVEPSRMLDAYLFKPAAEGRHPAVVFMHGCGGLLTSSGQMNSRQADWAARLVALGYVVLAVDSFSPRGIDRMCAAQRFQLPVYLERPKDAYGALRHLQAQPFVRPDRIALMGWSQGGGVVLLSVREDSLGRPRDLPLGDFRAAVAFYPASCRDGAHRVPWKGTMPLLVLIGEQDNWTPTEPCKQFVDRAAARGSDIRIQVYPGAYHDFDWPNLPVRHHPEYRTTGGVVPVTGIDPAARADALARVPEFLAKHLRD